VTVGTRDSIVISKVGCMGFCEKSKKAEEKKDYNFSIEFHVVIGVNRYLFGKYYIKI
jgi:hypothetical protein